MACNGLGLAAIPLGHKNSNSHLQNLPILPKKSLFLHLYDCDPGPSSREKC